MRANRSRQAAWFGAAVTLLFLLAASASGQQDLTGRAILGYTFFGDPSFSTDGFNQLYEVGYQRQVSEPLRFRLFFRGLGNRGMQDFAGSQTQSSYWQLQPLAEVYYILPFFSIVGRYDYSTELSHYGDQPQSTRMDQRAFETLNWAPEALPSVLLHGEQYRDTESSASIDEAQSLVSAAVSYGWRGLTIGGYGLYRVLDLYETGFHGTEADAQALGKYERTFFDGRASVNANATVGIQRLEQASGSVSGASVPNQATISSAAYAYDETPLDSRDATGVPAPALLDGDVRASAGISLGPDGSSFQNLTLDMARYLVLDTFRVFVRDRTGEPVPIGGLVSWDVYVTDNGLDWRLVGSADSRFIASLSAYEITFPETRSRYFKLVSFGISTLATYVTEAQAFFHTALAANTTRETDVHFLSAMVSASGTPATWLNLSYNGVFNDYKTTNPDSSQFSSVDNDQLLSADFMPSQAFDLTVRAENRTVSPSEGAKQTYQTYTGIFTYRYNPNLVTTIEADRVHQTGENPGDVVTTTLRASEYLRLLPTVYFQLDGGVANQDQDFGNLSSKAVFFDGTGSIQLTQSWLLQLNANYSKTHYEGPLASVTGGLDQIASRYYLQLQYRPSGAVNLMGRFGVTTVNGTRFQIRGGQLWWYPLAGGTVGIGTIYSEDADVNAEFRRFRTLQVTPSWILNPHAVLNLNYNLLQLHQSLTPTSPGTDTTARQFYVTLTLTL